MTSIIDGEVGSSVRDKLNKLFPNYPTINITGAWLYDPIILAVSPCAVKVGATTIAASGIWIDTFNYNEIYPSLVSIEFADLAGICRNFVMSGADLVPPELLESINCPELIAVGGQLNFASNVLTSAQFGALVAIGDLLNINAIALETIDLSSLVAVGNTLNIIAGAVVNLNLSSLKTTGGDIGLTNCSLLATVDFSSLSVIGGAFAISNCPITELNFPALTTVGVSFQPAALASLTTLVMPAIVKVGTRIEISTGAGGAPLLTDMTLGATLKYVGGRVRLDDVALNEASVDNILVRLAALDGTGGTTSYDNKEVTITGTSVAPSATGLAAKATLEGRGCTVTVN